MNKTWSFLRRIPEEMTTTAEVERCHSNSSNPIVLDREGTNNKSYGSTESFATSASGSRSASPTCNTNSVYEYEDFDSKLRTVTCPTCAGTGKLAKG